MTDDEKGGPEWERNEAAKRWAEASMNGDADAIARAADRMGDAVVNATAARLIPTLEQTLSVVLKREFIERDNTQTARWKYTLDQLEHLITKADSQYDAYGAELAKVLEFVQESHADRVDLRRIVERHSQDIALLKRHLGLDGDGK